MSDLIRRSWKFILERLSTSTLSVVLFSVIIPVVVFGLTSVHAWRTSGNHVQVAQILKETVAPTAISIGVTVFGLLLLLGWGIVAILLRDYQSMKVTISEHSKEIGGLQTELDEAAQTLGTSDPWLSLLHERKKLETELQPLLRIEESGIKIVPQVKTGKDESDYRREQIERLKRDIEDISKRLASEEASKDAYVSLPSVVIGPQRDWRREWTEMEAKFRKLGNSSIFADQSDISDADAWEIRSDEKTEKLEECKALCELAGSKLIASSPAIQVSETVRSQTENWKRWLQFLKETQGFTEAYTISSTRARKSFTAQAGLIKNLAQASAIGCIKCAATTYAKQQQE